MDVDLDRRFEACARVVVIGSLLLAPACGGARPPTERETSAAFARMQVGEARIATASPRARDRALDCLARSRAAREVCAAAEDVCAEAAPLADADAEARCEDARDACADVTGAVGADCGPGGAGSER